MASTYCKDGGEGGREGGKKRGEMSAGLFWTFIATFVNQHKHTQLNNPILPSLFLQSPSHHLPTLSMPISKPRVSPKGASALSIPGTVR